MKNRRIQKLELKNINTDRVTDGGYQRTLDTKRVKGIAKKFNEALVDTPLVADRHGVLYVVDGQHTIATLISVGIDKYDCAVMDSTGRQDEAPVFIAANSTGSGRGKSVSPFERYSAGILCDDPVYIGLRDLLQKYGVSIYGGKIHDKTRTIAIGVLEELYKTRRSSLIAGLDLINSIWGGVDDHAWSADMLRGCADFASKLTEDNKEQAIKRLKKVSCLDIIGKTKQVAKALDTRTQHCMCQVLASIAKINLK